MGCRGAGTRSSRDQRLARIKVTSAAAGVQASMSTSTRSTDRHDAMISRISRTHSHPLRYRCPRRTPSYPRTMRNGSATRAGPCHHQGSALCRRMPGRPRESRIRVHARPMLHQIRVGSVIKGQVRSTTTGGHPHPVPLPPRRSVAPAVRASGAAGRADARRATALARDAALPRPGASPGPEPPAGRGIGRSTASSRAHGAPGRRRQSPCPARLPAPVRPGKAPPERTRPSRSGRVRRAVLRQTRHQ